MNMSQPGKCLYGGIISPLEYTHVVSYTQSAQDWDYSGYHLISFTEDLL